MGAVTLAVAISVVFVAIQSGFEAFIFDIVLKYLPHVTISPVEGKDYIHLYRSIIETSSSIPGVIAVSPNIAAIATMVNKKKSDNVVMIGVNPLEENKISGVKKVMVEGDFNSILGGNRIVMGRPLAKKLNLKIGDTFQVSFPDASTRNLLVSGIFEYGIKPVDESKTFVSIDTAQRFLGKGDVLTSIEIKLKDQSQAEAVANELKSLGYNAKSWQQSFSDIVRNLAFERTRNDIILLLLLIIATFGIASIMNVLVQEKTVEIGMLMAMGATPGNIRRLFMLESGLLGLLGAILGCILGLVVSLQLQKIQITGSVGQTYNLPILINPLNFFILAFIAVVLSIAAGTYPAYKASQLDPVIAIKG
ncbi:MAG TPA: FtsX-like permease family protein [Methanothrix soehngenii]|nr:FtsX-like permease family protein [Methanothrix soehngenii]